MAKRKTNADELHRSGFRCSNHFRAVWSYSPMYKQWGPAGWAPRPLFFDAHDSNTPNFSFLLEWLKMASNPPHSPSVRILFGAGKIAHYLPLYDRRSRLAKQAWGSFFFFGGPPSGARSALSPDHIPWRMATGKGRPNSGVPPFDLSKDGAKAHRWTHQNLAFPLRPEEPLKGVGAAGPYTVRPFSRRCAWDKDRHCFSKRLLLLSFFVS